MARKQNVYGEGNYEASRKYDEATKKFIDSGRVEQAARDAEPKTEREAAEMAQAEQAGLERAKDKKPSVKEPPKPRPTVKALDQVRTEPTEKTTGASSRGPKQR